MRLIKLEISGFKSFADRTKIIFPRGVSAIVGPNGCGKSNVVDALRWVMGEQSIKKLRGKNSTDIIFSGADNKQPVNLAEVSLTFTNESKEEKSSGVEYTEYMITRKILRSGENQYFLNKRPCRLKDIQALFLGTGTGKNSFAVIQQGNIGALTEASPEQLRYYIEDAADVTKYKAQKQEVLSKIKSTKENLERIKDISLEVSRQMEILQKQVKKAEKYIEYQKSIKFMEIISADFHINNFNQEIKSLKADLDKIKNSEKELQKNIQQNESNRIKISQDVKSVIDEINEKTDSKFEYQREFDKKKQESTHLHYSISELETTIEKNLSEIEKIESKNFELKKELEKQQNTNENTSKKINSLKKELNEREISLPSLQSKFSEIKKKIIENKKNEFSLATEEVKYTNALNTLKNNLNIISKKLIATDENISFKQSELIAVQKKIDATAMEIEELNDEIKELNDGIKILDTKLDNKNLNLEKKKKHLDQLKLKTEGLAVENNSLKNILESFEGLGKGVASILRMPENERIENGIDIDEDIDILFNFLDVDEGYEKAVQKVFAEFLNNITLSSMDSASELVRYIINGDNGECGIIVSELVAPYKKLTNDYDKYDCLLKHIKISDNSQHIIETIIGDTIVVESSGELISLGKSLDKPPCIVTKNGDVFLKNGFIKAGFAKNSSGLLETKARINSLEKKIAENYVEVIKQEKEFEELSEEASEIKEYKNKTILDLEDAESELKELQQTFFTHNEDKKQAERTLKILSLEKEQYKGEEYDNEIEIEKFSKKLKILNDKILHEKKESNSEETQAENLTKKIESINKACNGLKLELSTYLERSANHEKSVNQLKNFLNEGIKRAEQLKVDVETQKAKIELYGKKIIGFKDDSKKLNTEIKIMADAIKNKESSKVLLENKLIDLQKENNDLKDKSSSINEKKIKTELKFSELKLKKEGLENNIIEKYHYALPVLIREFGHEINPDFRSEIKNDTLKFEDKLKKLKIKIQNLGEVNHSAIREYEELKKRNSFIQEQHDDLIQAIDELNKIILKINKVTQNKFLETFNLINEKLSEIFPKLFEGGTAELKILDSTNLLETGLEFMIKPPGKKVTNLGLLSGGEKALCAIAFIFSIFLIKPASFCIMDEIDAPLDDANVFRFNNLIKIIGDKSQILIITHNKLTMEFADILFGVTMEKKGVSKIVSVDLEI